jgi:hypothetical protein
MSSKESPLSKEEREQRLKEYRLQKRFHQAITQARERLRQAEADADSPKRSAGEHDSGLRSVWIAPGIHATVASKPIPSIPYERAKDE